MFCSVKDIDISLNSLCRNQVWILRHVSSTIDLAFVIDGLSHPDAGRGLGVGAHF